MADNHKLKAKLEDQKGAVILTVAGSLILVLAISSLAIDVGFLMVSRNEVQNVADASALAGTRLLGVIYETIPYEAQQSYVADPAPIIARAKTAARHNDVANKSIDLANADIEIGDWDGSTKTFTPTLTNPNAVRVTAHRDDSVNGKIPTFFARVMGIRELGVSATATAALTGQSTAPETSLPIPVGISKYWFTNPSFCNQPIKFYPTGTIEGCAGWNVYDEGNSNDSKLRKILKGLLDYASGDDDGYRSPETVAYESIFSFTGGTQSQQTFLAFKDLFDYCKGLNDGVIDKDLDSTTWTTAVPVYDWPDCSNPNTSILIVGFASVVIDNVLLAPDKTITGHVKCNMVQGGRGSGLELGTMGSIPGLVQ